MPDSSVPASSASRKAESASAPASGSATAPATERWNAEPAAPVLRSRAFWLTMLACFVIYLPSLAWTLGLDQNIFAEAGSLLLRGKTPYVDFWDVKPPNIFYTYGLFEFVFGQHVLAVRLADFFATLFAAAALYLAVHRRVRHRALSASVQFWSPIVAALLLVLTLLSLGLSDTAQTESFALGFVLLAPYLAFEESNWGRIAAGACVAIAAFFKTTNAVFLVPIIIEAFALRRMREHRARTIGLLLLGFTLWSGLQLLVLAMQGALGEYLRISLNVFEMHPHEASTLQFRNLLRALWVSVDLWLVVAAAGALWALVKEDNRFFRALRLPLMYLGAGLLAVYVQNKGWGYHYVIAHPGLMSSCAIAAVYLFHQVQRRHPTAAVVLVAVVVVAALFASPSGWRRLRQVRSSWTSITSHPAYLASLGSERSLYYPPCTDSLAGYLAHHSTSSDRLFIFGEEPGAYWRADRLPASRYIYSLLFASGVIPSEELTKMSESLARTKPPIVVVERFDTLHFRGRPETSESMLRDDNEFRALRTSLASSYRLTDTVCGKFLIYRLTGAASE